MRILSWTPPDDWTGDLRRVSPPGGRLSHLELAWHPDVERWALYEMFPPWAPLPLIVDEELPTDEEAVFAAAARETVPFAIRRNRALKALALPTRKQRWYHQPHLPVARDCVDHVEWRLWTRTGYFPRLFWIIQGHRGGHPRTFNQLEQQACRLQQLPTDPPVPGDLPYAPFDNRVVEQVRRYDQLVAGYWLAKGLKDLTDRTIDGRNQQRMEAQREFRAQLFRWVDDMTSQAVDECNTMAGFDTTHMPRTDVDWTRKADEQARTILDPVSSH